MNTQAMAFGERLREAVVSRQTPAIVGLDPRREHLPPALRDGVKADDAQQVARLYERYCCDVLDVVGRWVPAVKPQMAFFEEWGIAGLAALQRVMDHARQHHLLVLLDAKRGDIASTAEAYARAYLGPDAPWQADALTVNPYMGPESWSPFVQRARQVGAGVFLLVKTSNVDSAFIQDIRDAQGVAVYERVADWLEEFAVRACSGQRYGDAGAVVGATYAEQLSQLRQRMPHVWMLVPGFGAQGAGAADTAGAFDEDGTGALINASRSVLFAYEREPYRSRYGPMDWQRAVEDALRDMIDALAADTPAAHLRKCSSSR